MTEQEHPERRKETLIRLGQILYEKMLQIDSLPGDPEWKHLEQREQEMWGVMVESVLQERELIQEIWRMDSG
jgi:hypothetical protein